MPLSTIQSDVSSRTLARQLSDLLPEMRLLLRPGGRERRHEPPPPEIRGRVRMMKILHQAGQLTMNDLAEAMHVTPPTVTGIVKRGVAQGIVVRIPDPEDGRLVHVALTDTGRNQMETFRASHIAMLERLLSDLDAGEQRAIEAALPALERLLAVARSTSGATPRPCNREG